MSFIISSNNWNTNSISKGTFASPWKASLCYFYPLCWGQQQVLVLGGPLVQYKSSWNAILFDSHISMFQKSSYLVVICSQVFHLLNFVFVRPFLIARLRSLPRFHLSFSKLFLPPVIKFNVFGLLDLFLDGWYPPQFSLLIACYSLLFFGT